MTVEVKVPRLAESVSDAVLVEWLKDDGTVVRTDEPIATLETDKAAVEIPATESGVLHHARQAGDRVHVGDVLANIETNATATATTESVPVSDRRANETASAAAAEEIALSPAVRRLIEEHGLKPQEIESSGRGGRLLKEDVLRHLERTAKGAEGASAAAPKDQRVVPLSQGPASAPQVSASRAARMESPPPRPQAPAPPDRVGQPRPAAGPEAPPAPGARSKDEAPAGEIVPAPAAAPPHDDGADDQIVPMSRIRQRIAERLVRAQHTAAILTTFNEIDMTEVLALRTRYRENFERRHGVKLGFMSFFSRACILALAEIPELNAEIRDGSLVYHRRVHLGIAVQTERGLVVPVVRDADRLGFAELEREIARLAERGRDGILTLHELSGGTFTISNGGVFGSLLSTPILNPPQSGILGMHKIERRPIAVDDQVVVRSMMYVALSYDHRIVDGQQAVTFLVRVKACLEDPGRMLLDV